MEVVFVSQSSLVLALLILSAYATTEFGNRPAMTDQLTESPPDPVIAETGAGVAVKTKAKKKLSAAEKLAEAAKAPATLTKYQTFVVERMNRSALAAAPYNPRLITDVERAKLKRGLAKHGMVTTVTWNRRTGHLVGGHQRLTQLDALEGSPNYELDVAVIDVPESKEKEINILLNNQQAQGQWDLDALGMLLKDSEIELEATGFDSADVHQLFGESIAMSRDDPLDEMANKIREARDRYDEVIQKMSAKSAEGFYLVVIFRTAQDCDDFTKRYGLPENRYQSADEVEALIKRGGAPK